MKILTIVLCVLMPIFVMARGSTSQFASTNMDRQCGATILLNGDSLPGIFFSFSSKTYQRNIECQLTIKGSTNSQRIIIVIDQIDVACVGDQLLIYDGKMDAKFLLNSNNSLQCGKKNFYVRTSQTNTAIIRFISNDDSNVGQGFTINAAIHFPVATCSRSDNLYRCRNHNCISNYFNCDDRNWCGDNTQQFVC